MTALVPIREHGETRRYFCVHLLVPPPETTRGHHIAGGGIRRI